MSDLAARLAPLAWACDLTVCIPAKNEERLLPRALEALARQRSAYEQRLWPGRFDVLVFANDCEDATAHVARRFAQAHPCLPIYVVEGSLPAGRAHVGSARRFVLELAAARRRLPERRRDVLATTDADTVVGFDWVAAVLCEMGSADAVAGHVTLAESEYEKLAPYVRRLYDWERRYREAFAEVEGALDPLLEDPAPRHSSFVGASFAVTVEAYAAAGGLPAVPSLEDRAFFFALRRIDARVRHSLRVRACTSARRQARAAGGFGAFIDELHCTGREKGTFLVVHAKQSLLELERRAALRALWRHGATIVSLDRVSRLFGLSRTQFALAFDGEASFGTNLERLGALAPRDGYDEQPVELATAELSRAAATAFIATRTSAASGAG